MSAAASAMARQESASTERSPLVIPTRVVSFTRHRAGPSLETTARALTACRTPFPPPPRILSTPASTWSCVGHSAGADHSRRTAGVSWAPPLEGTRRRPAASPIVRASSAAFAMARRATRVRMRPSTLDLRAAGDKSPSLEGPGLQLRGTGRLRGPRSHPGRRYERGADERVRLGYEVSLAR
jgi:hypothetical protein